MKNSRALSDRKFRAVTLAALALDHIPETYAPLRHAAELLARTVDATPATAKNWLRRLNAPHADHIGVLIERDPDFRAKMRAFIEACDAQNADR